MEQTKLEIGLVTYVIGRKFVGKRPLKDVILETMLSAAPPLDITPQAVIQ